VLERREPMVRPPRRAFARRGVSRVGAAVARWSIVAVQAWPTFQHNGLRLLGSGVTSRRQVETMQATSRNPPRLALSRAAWPYLGHDHHHSPRTADRDLSSRCLVDLHRRARPTRGYAAIAIPVITPARVGALGRLG